MGRPHSFHLILGSNIQPEENLAEAIRALEGHGKVPQVSSAWQSHAVGSDGPDFLNVALEFRSNMSAGQLKDKVIAGIEARLGRQRSRDKYAARTIDIDLLAEDGRPLRRESWDQIFVVVPLAELLPDLAHPITGRPLSEEATSMRAATWIRLRPDVLPRGVGRSQV